jgi:hypothetical protein
VIKLVLCLLLSAVLFNLRFFDSLFLPLYFVFFQVPYKLVCMLLPGFLSLTLVLSKDVIKVKRRLGFCNFMLHVLDLVCCLNDMLLLLQVLFELGSPFCILLYRRLQLCF